MEAHQEQKKRKGASNLGHRGGIEDFQMQMRQLMRERKPLWMNGGQAWIRFHDENLQK